MDCKGKIPEVVVGIFIINNNKLLLVRSHKWNNKLVVPGGHVEYMEPLEKAAIREIKEETGLNIERLEFIMFHEYLADGDFFEKRHFIMLDYLARTNSKEVKLNKEAQKAEWLAIEELKNNIDEYDIEHYTKKTIKQMIKKGMI